MASLDLVGKIPVNYPTIKGIRRGGIALGYRGQQPSLNRDAGIEVLPSQIAFDQELAPCREREAEAAAGPATATPIRLACALDIHSSHQGTAFLFRDQERAL